MKILSIEKTDTLLRITTSPVKLSRINIEDLKCTSIDYGCSLTISIGSIIFEGGEIENAYNMCLILANELPEDHEHIKEENKRIYAEVCNDQDQVLKSLGQ